MEHQELDQSKIEQAICDDNTGPVSLARQVGDGLNQGRFQ